MVASFSYTMPSVPGWRHTQVIHIQTLAARWYLGDQGLLPEITPVQFDYDAGIYRESEPFGKEVQWHWLINPPFLAIVRPQGSPLWTLFDGSTRVASSPALERVGQRALGMTTAQPRLVAKLDEECLTNRMAYRAWKLDDKEGDRAE